MLEAAGALRTWRLATPPSAQVPVLAEAIGDHRSHYLDYEGPVSGGRGVVRRWDAGTLEWLPSTAVQLCFRLEGAQVRGECSLSRRESGVWELTINTPRV
jgi:hypothetical protein